jgi:integrase
VFAGPRGGPLDRNHFAAEHLKPALRAAGLPTAFRMYDLRHTCASLLAAEGWTPNEVAAQLGHADAAITLRVYTHLFPDRRAALVDRLDGARAAALEAFRAGAWPQRDPAVVPLTGRAGQPPG